jgi:DNA-binding response OmpR family regulator
VSHTPGGVGLNVDDNDRAFALGTPSSRTPASASSRPNLEQALAIASDAHPSLVLLDVMLPDLDGLEVAGV